MVQGAYMSPGHTQLAELAQQQANDIAFDPSAISILDEAVTLGVLPAFKYVSCSPPATCQATDACCLHLTCCHQHVLTCAIHAAQPKNKRCCTASLLLFFAIICHMAYNATDHALCNFHGKLLLILRLFSSLFSLPKGTTFSALLLPVGWMFLVQWTCGGPPPFLFPPR